MQRSYRSQTNVGFVKTELQIDSSCTCKRCHELTVKNEVVMKCIKPRKNIILNKQHLCYPNEYFKGKSHPSGMKISLNRHLGRVSGKFPLCRAPGRSYLGTLFRSGHPCSVGTDPGETSSKEGMERGLGNRDGTEIPSISSDTKHRRGGNTKEERGRG